MSSDIPIRGRAHRAALIFVCATASAVQAQQAPPSTALPVSPSVTQSATPVATPPPTLAEALAAAWALSAPARSFANRQAELDARAQAAQGLLAAPPSVTLSQRSDRTASNLGLREYEAGIELPLWNPGMRDATARQVAAERGAFERQQATARLELAGQLRELAASGALAALERDLATRKRDEARTLARDVLRRVAAGDSARVDALLAEATERQAATLAVQAEAALEQTRSQWRALTGLAHIAEADETVGASPAAEHPAVAGAQAGLRAAMARLALTEADRRDPLELGLGVTRERSVFGEAARNALRLSLRVPLGSDARNAPRLAAARAELDAAQADSEAAERRIAADITAARTALAAAHRAQSFATERAALSREARALIAKSWQLGESDLPTRLRADNEAFDAELALARARVEAQRATSRLNQALGLLP